VCLVALHGAEARPSVCRGDGCEGKAMPVLSLLPLQLLCVRLCWLPCLRLRAGALLFVMALHRAEAEPLVCRGYGCEGKAMPVLGLLPLQLLCVRLCWLPCLRLRAGALLCVIALHGAEAEPLVCRGYGCEGKAMPVLGLLPLQLLCVRPCWLPCFPGLPSTEC